MSNSSRILNSPLRVVDFGGGHLLIDGTCRDTAFRGDDTFRLPFEMTAAALAALPKDRRDEELRRLMQLHVDHHGLGWEGGRPRQLRYG